MNCYHSLPSSHSSQSSHTHPCPVPITHTCFLHTSPTPSPAPHSLFAHVPRITHPTLLILHKGIPHTSPLLSPHQLTPSSPLTPHTHNSPLPSLYTPRPHSPFNFTINGCIYKEGGQQVEQKQQCCRKPV